MSPRLQPSYLDKLLLSHLMPFSGSEPLASKMSKNEVGGPGDLQPIEGGRTRRGRRPDLSLN